MMIRDAVGDDAAAINAIYNHYITDTHVSFDTVPWSEEGRRRWVEEHATNPLHPVLVGVVDGAVVGFASGSTFRPKAAYAQSVETTIVLHPDTVGKGLGRPLLEALLVRLAEVGAHRAYAIVALPNDASVRVHKDVGYTSLGVQHEVGRKFDRYWSTELLEYRFT